MIDLLIFYGFGVIMGSILHEGACPKTDHKQSINRPITDHKASEKRPLAKRRPFLPWEARRRNKNDKTR